MPKYLFNAREVQSLLNGFICLYKPRDVSISALENHLLKKICIQANQLDNDRPLPIIELPLVDCHPSTGASMVVGKKQQIDYSMHPLIFGQMFSMEDFSIESLSYLGPPSSGICLFGLNNGCDQLKRIKECGWLNEYILDGELGKETIKNSIRGKINFCAEFDHVNINRMNKLLSKIEMYFKKAAFKMANVDLQSEEAFELARKGAPRPRVMDNAGSNPIIYGIQLIRFKPPLFKLRIQSVGESDLFLRELVHQIGCSLDTTARPRRVQRVKQGCFGLEHALLDKHFHLENILKNVLMCGKMVEKELTKERREVVEAKTNREEDGLMAQKYGMNSEKLEEIGEIEEDCLRLPFGREYTIC